MDFRISPLTPAMADIFADYLSNLDFTHAPYFATCFCRFYHINCTDEEWMERKGEQNREESKAAIKDGSMKGYLAFNGNKCIGWLNANSVDSYLRLEDSLTPFTEDKKAGLAICFVIHPDYRNQGIATSLLEKAIEGFKEEGYEVIFGLSTKNADIPLVKQYSGTYTMFSKLGFEEVGVLGHRVILRKWLSSP
ncbi:MAG: GNAT family N-acetyltransferase [Clostridiaceae bacterium]